MRVDFADVQKLCQTTGEWDRQRNQLTGNRTDSRVGLFGTDLGSSFEHNGRLWFLFGDTWPSRARVSSVAAVSRFTGRIDLFVLTQDGIVNVITREHDRWWDPTPLCNARFARSTRLAAVSRDRWHMEVFAVGEDGVLRGRWFWDDRWHDWYVLSDARFNQSAGLAAVSRHPKHMEVFAVGEDGVLRGRWFWDDRWHDWFVLGDARFSQTTGLAAVSRDPKHMEVFAVGEDGVLRGRWFWDDRWHDWFVLGEKQFPQTAGLAAVSMAPGLMDLFSMSDDGSPWWTWFKNPGWAPWDHPVETLTDSVAWTSAQTPGDCLPLEFINSSGPCARYRSPRLTGLSGQLVNTAAFSVPIAGFSTNGKMYVFYSEYADQVVMGRTYLTVADNGDPTSLHALYVASTADTNPLKDGHFINIACKVVDQANPSIGGGLPFSGPALLMWGTGRYRKSDVYLAAVPLALIENRSAWHFYTGLPLSRWSADEHRARPLFEAQAGELSVTWLDGQQVWLLLYNGETPIMGRVASTPWGPWSDARVVIDTESTFGYFVHRAGSTDGLSDPGRVAHGGGLYGAYVIDRFTQTLDATTSKIYFLLSTWNPYNTVLMSARVTVT